MDLIDPLYAQESLSYRPDLSVNASMHQLLEGSEIESNMISQKKIERVLN